MKTEPRIVTLLASATEIVCALGFEDAIVGRSHECDFPETIRDRPVCTAPKFDTTGASREIDRRVRDIVEQGLSVYKVDAERLRALDPAVIVTQTQCEVCAVSFRDLEAALGDWTGADPRVVSLEPDALADLWADIGNVAAALGAPERGATLVAALQARMAAVAERARGVAAPPTVACIEWIDPLMAAGNWMPELVAMAGGVNLFGEAGRHAPWMDWEDLVAADPEVVLVLPCGFDIDRARRDMPALTARPGWDGLRAVRTGRVFLANGNQYFNRPGPRLAESLEIAAELLHPALFPPRYEGTGWARL